MKATITVGISASGKSTWADSYLTTFKTQLGVTVTHKPVVSNRDDIRFNIILDGVRDWSKYKFNKTNENRVTEIQEAQWVSAARSGQDLIVADTNLNKGKRENLKAKLEALGYEVEYKFFPITLEEAWRRDSFRANGVGQSIIYKQWQQWNGTIGRRVYVPDVSLPKAVIFDVDGTLAHMDGKRGPFDWDKVGTDVPDEVVRNIFNSIPEETRIIALSGRDGVCYGATSLWLGVNSMWPNALLMREAGDMRKDSIIKEEIFFRDIAPNYNVIAVFDDRPQVVRMWHDIKIPKVISCANQHIEF